MERTSKDSSLTERIEKTLISAVLFAVTVRVFFAVGEMSAIHTRTAWLATHWDACIPLMPAAVWPYLSWYLAPWFLLAAPRRDFRRMASAIVLAFAICMVTYMAVPVSLERPAVVGRTLSEHALLLLYEYDPPCNIFPSFHAALCALLFRPVFGGPFARKVMPVWMSTICVACVLTKQHDLLDIVAGLLVGFVALAVATVAMNHWGQACTNVTLPHRSRS